MTDTAHGGWPDGRILPVVVSDFSGTVKVSGQMSQTLLPLLQATVTTVLLSSIAQDYEGEVLDTPIATVRATSAAKIVSGSGAI